MKVQGSLSESSEIMRLCQMICRSHDDQRAGSLLKQQIMMDHQIGKAACVLFFPQPDIMCHPIPATIPLDQYQKKQPTNYSDQPLSQENSRKNPVSQVA